MDNSNKKSSKISASRMTNSVLSWIMLIISIVWLLPVLFTVMNSFKELKDVITQPLSFPKTFTLDNYVEVWKTIGYPRLLWNSTYILIISEFFLILFCSMAGYWLQRNSRKKGALLCRNYFLLSMFVLFQAIMLSMIALFCSLNMQYSRSGVIISNIGLQAAMGIFLYFGYCQQIPSELDEAAYVDGASTLQIFFQIIFPLMGPMTATVLILTGLGVWNDFLKPSLLIQNPEFQTLTVGTASVVNGQYFIKYNLAVTALVLSAVPMIIAFIFLQRKIVSGVVSGAVKG